MKKDFSMKFEEMTSKAKNFFDEVKDKAEEYVDTKSLELQAIANLKIAEKDLEKAYCNYGKVMYAIEKSGDNKRVGICMVKKLKAEIEEIEERIEYYKREIEELKAEKGEAETTSNEVVFCSNCGKKHSADKKFCSKCGNNLND